MRAATLQADGGDGDDLIEGGDGDDDRFPLAETGTVLGGAGNDRLRVWGALDFDGDSLDGTDTRDASAFFLNGAVFGLGSGVHTFAEGPGSRKTGRPEMRAVTWASEAREAPPQGRADLGPPSSTIFALRTGQQRVQAGTPRSRPGRATDARGRLRRRLAPLEGYGPRRPLGLAHRTRIGVVPDDAEAFGGNRRDS